MLNLIYAVIQLIHNLGAATIIAAPALGWHGKLNEPATARRYAAITALGWTTQIVSGAGFGIVSHYIKGQLPEIGGVALIALFIKVACALGGLITATVILRTAAQGDNANPDLWAAMLVLGVTALSAAAFLRWYL
jgi:hypothetical protein